MPEVTMYVVAVDSVLNPVKSVKVIPFDPASHYK